MICSRKPLLLCFVLSCVGLVQGGAAAKSAVDQLSRMLPDDVVYFAATGGYAAQQDECQKSSLGQIWNDPGMRKFASSIKRELLTQLKQDADNSDAEKIIAMVIEYAQLTLNRPLVIGVAEAEVTDGPPACVFAILDAGNQKPELATAVKKIEGLLGEGEVVDTQIGSVTMRSIKDNDDVPLYWGWVGTHWVMAVNDAQGIVTKHVLKPREIPTDHLKKISGQGDVLAVFCDVQKIADIVMRFATSEGNQKDLEPIKVVLQELGCDTIGTIAARVGFSGSNLVGDSFVELPAPRTGLFAAFKAVEPSLFNLVDARVAMVTAFHCNMTGFYNTVMKTIEKVSPDEGYPEIRKALTALESDAGFGIRDDLLKSLSGPMIFYTLPAGKIPEVPLGGAAAILKLDNAELFEKTMKKIGAFAEQKSGGMLQVNSQTIDNGRTIHIWASPALAVAQVMPSWSIVKDHVVFGSTTALCKTSIKQIASRGQDTMPLQQAEGFKKATATMPNSVWALTYTDSQVMFSQLMTQAQQVWPMATMMAMRKGLKLPMVLPSFQHIIKEMQSSCEYSYLDSDGIHSHYQGTGIEVNLRGIATSALGMGILMPALGRTRQLALRMTSATHLSGIGKACLIYANDYDDKLPPDLESLITIMQLPPQFLESKQKPKGFDGPSFIYIPGQDITMSFNNIVAYENPLFCSDGVNVLFMDSHVAFVKPERFKQQLEATYKRLDREMPEIRFQNDSRAPD